MAHAKSAAPALSTSKRVLWVGLHSGLHLQHGAKKAVLGEKTDSVRDREQFLDRHCVSHSWVVLGKFFGATGSSLSLSGMETHARPQYVAADIGLRQGKGRDPELGP